MMMTMLQQKPLPHTSSALGKAAVALHHHVAGAGASPSAISEGHSPAGAYSGKRVVCMDEVPGSNSKKFRNALGEITNAKEMEEEKAATNAPSAQGMQRTCSAPASLHHVDVDAPHRHDPQACTSYVCDIYRNLRVAETKRRPNSFYLEHVQRDIDRRMRAILVDWMVEVAEEYKLVPETLHLSICYMDRFLSVQPVVRSKLQLVGVGCLLIASKYEEIFPQGLDEFCFITDKTYSKHELLNCEREILQALEFQLTIPTIRPFLRRFLRAAQADTKTEFFAMYLAELALLEYEMLSFLPSQIAASAVLLAQIILNKPIWNATLQWYSGYTKIELQNCTRALHRLMACAEKSHASAVKEKYAEHTYKCVSTVTSSYSSLPHYLFTV